MTYDNSGWLVLLAVTVVIEVVQILRRAPTLTQQWKRGHRALSARWRYGKFILPAITAAFMVALFGHLVWGWLRG